MGGNQFAFGEMQWSRKKRDIHVIGSANHPLLLKRYSSFAGKHYEFSGSKWENGYRTPGGYQLYEKSTRRKPSSTSSSAVPLSKPTYPSKEETKRLVEGKSQISFYYEWDVHVINLFLIYVLYGHVFSSSVSTTSNS